MRNGQSLLAKTPLSLMIALVLAAPVASAQDEASTGPSLLATVDEKAVYIINRSTGEQTDVATGESVVVNDDGATFIPRPSVLDWPCGTELAGNRGSMENFAYEDLPVGDRIAEVTTRYFENQQVLDQRPRFLNGESHGTLTSAEISEFESNAFWYKSGPAASERIAALRPDTLLIGLFYGTGQVVVDNNHLEALKAEYGDDPIPVVFVYQEENVVPVSYFGENAAPQQIMKAYQESGIKPADVPIWYAGDQHASAEPGALADALGVPPAEEISASKMQRLQQDIASNGFKGKPVTLAMVAAGEGMIADEGERLRAAEQAGIQQVPVLFSVYDANSVTSQCGLTPPVAAAGLLGTAEGEAPGATPSEPDNPIIPPEILPPYPPPVEPPVSGN